MKNKNSESFKKNDESVLVVKRNELFSTIPVWQGINTKDIDAILTTITSQHYFYNRTSMEQDPSYKQIIPYMIFTHSKRYFLMRRKSKASEQRLKNKYTLGIGGHVRKEDITDSSIFNWARREFEEEVHYSGDLNIKTVGIINDDSNEVGKVHLGLLLLIHGDKDAISIKSELESGELQPLSLCETYYDQMESWSQIAIRLLMQLEQAN